MVAMVGCGDSKLPPRPDGLSCTHFAGVFFCNEINNPDIEKEFDKDSVEMSKAQCMPLETFERYQAYVQELKNLADRNCRIE
jgi:hypothetical protein